MPILKFAARGVLYTLLLLLFVVLLLGLYLRFQGLQLDRLSFANAEFEQVELSLAPRLNLSVQTTRLSLPEKPGEVESEATQLNLEEIVPIVQRVRWLAGFFTRIDLHHFEIDGAVGQFHYVTDGPGELRLSGGGHQVTVDISVQKKQLWIDIKEASLKHQALNFNGLVIADHKTNLVTADLDINVAQTLPVSVSVEVDREQLSFHGKGQEPITTIDPIVDLFGIGHNITKWFQEYLVASQFELVELSGSIPFDAPAKILQTMVAKAQVTDVEYTFTEEVDPVKAPEVEVVFEKGILHISPEQPTFYLQQAGNKSYVDIDFNAEQVYLTVHLDTRAQASGGILTVLDAYGIPFPFEQIAGKTDVDLDIGINLATEEVTADGKFKAIDSEFTYKHLRCDVELLDLELQTTHILFHQLRLGLGKVLETNITGDYEGLEGKGQLQLDVEKFDLSNQPAGLKLITEGGSSQVMIDLGPELTDLRLSKTHWSLGENKFSLDPTHITMDLAALTGTFSETLLDVPPYFASRLEGSFDIEKMKYDLSVDLTRLTLGKLNLLEPVNDISIQLDQGAEVKTQTPLHLSFQGIPVKVLPSHLIYQNERLRLLKSGFELNDMLRAQVQGNVALHSGGEIRLLQIETLDDQVNRPLDLSNITLQLSQLNTLPRIYSPEVGLALSVLEGGDWEVECPDISRFYPHSKLLQQLHLKDGTVHLRSHKETEKLGISGHFDFSEALLFEQETPIFRLHFSGWHKDGVFEATVNDVLNIHWKNALVIESKDIGFNITELLNIVERSKEADESIPAEHTNQVDAGTASESSTTMPLSVKFNATNTFLWMDKDRRILADTLSINYFDGQVNTVLSHAQGKAYLVMENDTFWLEGQNFEPPFINRLFLSLAAIEQGNLEFRVKGSFDDFEGAAAVNNTILKDYKALNNMLAFLNTIPGLVGFNPPEYTREGLLAREISAKFAIKDRKVALSSMLVDSSELTIKGKGDMDLNSNHMNMVFNLTTGMKKSFGRIPLLGYILVGDENNTIALKVVGDMENPEVSNTALKEIVSFPFKVIGRTILLPAHIYDEMKGPQPQASD